jgi:hypothetical protein
MYTSYVLTYTRTKTLWCAMYVPIIFVLLHPQENKSIHFAGKVKNK